MEEKNLNYRLIVTGVVILLLISGCIDTDKKVKEGDNVMVNITKEDTTRTIFINNISQEKTFEKELIGMKIGEKKNINYEEIVSVKLSQEPKLNTYILDRRRIKVINITDTHFYVELDDGVQKMFPKVFEISVDSFKATFGDKNPVKNRAYENLNFLPWPVKVVDVKTTTQNLTIEILDAGNFSCLERYGIDKGAVVFYYTDWCPHCQRMKPWIKNLTDQRYKFFSVEAEKERDKIKIVEICASEVIRFGRGVPQFGCPANGKGHIGAFMSIEDMKNFANECKS